MPPQSRSRDLYFMLRTVSRTFALSIEQLPSVLRETVAIAYLMFRVSDFLEDNAAMLPDQKVVMLDLWHKVLTRQMSVGELTARLADQDPTDPEAYVAQHADQVLKWLDRIPDEVQYYIIDEVRNTTLGMARWQARGPLVRDEADLDDYMFEVAGRVGYMLTHIFAWHYPAIQANKDRLMPLAREFGLALQTVNVIRGLRKDYERGWIFVPQSFCACVGLKPPDLFKSENLGQAVLVVEMLADKAERHLKSGLTYVKFLPRHLHRIRLACMWPLFFAVRTLAISRGSAAVLLDETKMSRQEVKQIVMDTRLAGWSNVWLDHYYQRLATP